ncbi:EAL domain-containing protein [Anaerobacillus sp. MEB173]|uniref:EAL domain-containing protein n=1 Tax=Anaerobacillus sp. MEB173 TaxID=3383345 RepID=UPI003F93230D
MSLKAKLMFIFLVVLLVPSITIGMVHSYQAKEQITNVAKQSLENEVKVILEMITFLEQKVELGHVTLEEAQEEMKEFLIGPQNEDHTRSVKENVNLGEHGYFFVIDKEANLIAHPTREGQNLTALGDINAVDFASTLIENAQLPNGGYTYYDWELPSVNNSKALNRADGLYVSWDVPQSTMVDLISPKITYTIQDHNWGWIIGASAYLFEINGPAVEVLVSTIISIVAFAFVGIFFINYAATRITKPITDLKESMEQLSEGKIAVDKLNTSRYDEVGLMNRAFVDLASSVSSFLTGLKKEVDTVIPYSKKENDSQGLNTLSPFTKAITEVRQQTEDHLRLSAKVFENSLEGITITDKNGDIIFVNPAFTNITGYTPEEVIGKNPNLLSSGKHDKAFYDGMWSSLKEKGQWKGEIWNRKKDGSLIAEWLTISSILDDSGETTHYASVFTDITDRKKQMEMIEYQANHDSLTGLTNRRLFNKQIIESLHSAKDSHRKMGIMFLDLDQFKNINDSFGHGFGDCLLQNIAATLNETVDDDVTLARLGGDEFILFYPAITDRDVLAEDAQKIIDKISQPITINGYSVVVTTSIGISVFPDDGEDLDSLIKNADIALYHAKGKGRNSYYFYESSMSEKVMKRVEYEAKLREAISEEQFQVYYQPKVEVSTGKIIGMEALLRWQHPEIGMISPSDFIPIAEETGLIIPIGEYVLRTACEQSKHWQQAGYPPIAVSVNIASQQLQKDYLLSLVTKVLFETGLEPKYLELEVTEGSLMMNNEETIEILTSLKEIGVKISIDDFGTGYSSLNYIKQFSIDMIKIDKSFVMNMTSDPNDTAIVKAIISMAHSLNMRVVAEGVETEEQFALLRDMGCEWVQGFLFSEPVTAIAFENIMEKEKYVQRIPCAHSSRLVAER